MGPYEEESNNSSFLVREDHPDSPEFSDDSKFMIIEKFNNEPPIITKQSIKKVLEVEDKNTNAKNKLA